MGLSPAVAQEVSGAVHNQHDRPLADVRLRWTAQSGETAEAITDENGHYQLPLPQLTLVAFETAELPSVFALRQNYPNPFNPGTAIPFQIGADGTFATLTIYNIAGQSVRTLVAGDLSAGPHEILWDGRDDEGGPAAAGVYIYRLAAGAFAQQRKMLKVDGGRLDGSRLDGSRLDGSRLDGRIISKPAVQSVSYTVELTGEHILDRREQVLVDGDATFDFGVDERFLWTARASMPAPRQEIAAATLDGKIYVFGGLDDRFNSLSAVDVYDPRADTWESRNDMPLPLNHLATVAFEERIYILGGYVNFVTAELSRQTLEYDPAVDTWARRADMPLFRGAHGAALLEGRIYVLGGVGVSADEQTRAMIYDPAADTWEIGANMPVFSEHLAVAAGAGRVYAFSGRDFNRNRNEVQIYDPTADSWKMGAAIPTARSGIVALEWLGRFFVFGGELPGVFDENEAYDPETDSWEMLLPMPTARHGLAGGLVDGKIYIIGGGTIAGLRASDIVEEYIP